MEIRQNKRIVTKSNRDGHNQSRKIEIHWNFLNEAMNNRGIQVNRMNDCDFRMNGQRSAYEGEGSKTRWDKEKKILASIQLFGNFCLNIKQIIL